MLASIARMTLRPARLHLCFELVEPHRGLQRRRWREGATGPSACSHTKSIVQGQEQ